MSDKKIQNLEVGKSFIYDNKKIIVKLAENDMSCKGCIFYNSNIPCLILQSKRIIPECDFCSRDDQNSVIFEGV